MWPELVSIVESIEGERGGGGWVGHHGRLKKVSFWGRSRGDTGQVKGRVVWGCCSGWTVENLQRPTRIKQKREEIQERNISQMKRTAENKNGKKEKKENYHDPLPLRAVDRSKKQNPPPTGKVQKRGCKLCTSRAA